MVFPVEYSIFSDMKNIRQHLLSHPMFFTVGFYLLSNIISQ